MKTFVCQYCHKSFTKTEKEIGKNVRYGGIYKYCSRSCARLNLSVNNKGKNNPNWKEGISKNHYHYKKIQKQRYPERVKAREIVGNAKRSGKLTPKPCQNCGNKDVHAHHEDYSKPLEVEWFCRECHRELKHNGKH